MTTHPRKCNLEQTERTTAELIMSSYSRYLQFGVLSPQNMVKIAEFEVTQRDLYKPESRIPVRGGVLDLRLVRLMDL